MSADPPADARDRASAMRSAAAKLIIFHKFGKFTLIAYLCGQNRLIMKKLLLSFLTIASVALGAKAQNASSMIPSDGVLRFYRLAIPVTLTSFEEDLDSDYNQVLTFWQDCEDFVNEMFIPLGCCFDVVVDERLVMSEPNSIDDNIYSAPAYGTELLNAAIGSGAYDVGMWVTHRDVYAENSGLSVLGGAYSHSTKSSGYAKTDKWVVAHELGHMFGAPHTPTGEGSLMDTGGEFFAYPSIRTIRTQLTEKAAAYYSDAERTTLVGGNAGGNYVYGVKVNNAAPQFDAAMSASFRIPQGACLSMALKVSDSENHRLTSAAIGCNSATVDQLIEGGDLPVFASLTPRNGLCVEYSPAYAADIFDSSWYYPVDGTAIPDMYPGSYSISLLVNDMPDVQSCNYSSLLKSPFYSQYAVWEASVQIVSGTPFSVKVSPEKSEYSAGETISVEWGVNSAYFYSDSRLRITMSDDYGRTFSHVLAESVPALSGKCNVTIPNHNVGMVDVDFVTATRPMRGGIIRVEEIGGAAFSLSALSPMDNKSFTVSGATDDGVSSIDHIEAPDSDSTCFYDLRGVRVENPSRGIFIKRTPGSPAKLISLP
ncbi:MAG: hypothetical protein E7082_00080 [Bacteroidales bacterium]|nr:hypothetical protein [Bacteroidales bacterium]